MSCRQDVKTVRKDVSATLALYIINAATLRGANPQSVTAENIGGYQKMEQNKICPLLTTNTVVDENNTVKIGIQPVFCVTEQCSWWLEDKQKCAIAVMGGKK